jgi:hypothetical protein
MKHPPYPLRQNKAVDRFMLIDIIRQLEKFYDISEYTYYSLGGPYLEDFRLLYDFCPTVKMVSIESDLDTLKRQKFHLPCGHLELVLDEFTSFLANYDSNERKSIFWLDYIKLGFSEFSDYMTLLDRVQDHSIIKLTLRAEPKDYLDQNPEVVSQKLKAFQKEFEEILPSWTTVPSLTFEDHASLIQDMVRIASQKILPATGGRILQPLSSFCYADSVGMYTFTGVVCSLEDAKKYRKQFSKWPFANLDWSKPKIIDVPFLSTKERLHLQKFLPSRQRNKGRHLLKKLGYSIDNTDEMSATKLSHYADFHRYYPYFVKAIP